VLAHSDKAGARPTYKSTFGFHPIAVCVTAPGTARRSSCAPANGALPISAWSPALDADGGVREGAFVAELTGLRTRPAGRPGCGSSSAANARIPARSWTCSKPDGRRYTAFVTNTTTGQLQWLEVCPRAHPRVEDRAPLRQRHRPGSAAFPRVLH
jgi:hypothetical protein